MPARQDIEDTVDQLVDELDPLRVERAADRVGLTVEELLHRLAVEVQARLA